MLPDVLWRMQPGGPTKIMPGERRLFLPQLLLHHCLCCNACVICARDPEHIEPAHPFPSHHRILQTKLEASEKRLAPSGRVDAFDALSPIHLHDAPRWHILTIPYQHALKLHPHEGFLAWKHHLASQKDNVHAACAGSRAIQASIADP